MGGVERLRVRYRRYATPWYNHLFASRDEVAELVEGTGWSVSRFVDEGAGYVAVLELEPSVEPGFRGHPRRRDTIEGVPEARHMVAGDRNEVFNRAILDFLDRHR